MMSAPTEPAGAPTAPPDPIVAARSIPQLRPALARDMFEAMSQIAAEPNMSPTRE
jgi:hypothetical protein